MEGKIIRIIKSIFSIHKYPRYIEYYYTKVILQTLWRRQGINLEQGIVWLGVPIISLVKGSLICIGKECVICSRSDQTALGVNHPVVLRTLNSTSEIWIGQGVRMSGTTICAAEKVIIGNRCVIGANATIVDTDFHSLDPEIRCSSEDTDSAFHNAVEVGEDVFIGGGAFILKGVRVGNSAIIGAGSVVTKDIPDLGIVAGNPARLIGSVERGSLGKEPA